METNRDSEPAAPWNAEALRVTLFTSSDGGVPPRINWADLTGKDPDSFDHSQEDVQRWMGAFTPGWLQLTIQSNRVDWVLQPRPNVERAMPSLGPHLSAIETLASSVKEWFTKSPPPIIRVAFGPVLRHDVPDRRSGYVHLQQFLPVVQLDADGSTDLFYQINRPRKSLAIADGRIINRLSRWMVPEVRLIQFAAPGMQPVSAITYFCRLELDISTAADNTAPMNPDTLRSAFDEIVSAAIEISTSGDVP